MSALRKTVVLDSNLIVSAFLNPEGAASQAMQIAFDYFDVAASKDTLTELVDVLRRDKFDRYANKEDRATRVMAYAEATQKIQVTHIVTECSDPKDNKFLALALSSKACVLVSGDKKHLISMNPYQGLPIIGVRKFIETYQRYL